MEFEEVKASDRSGILGTDDLEIEPKFNRDELEAEQDAMFASLDSQ